MNPRMTLKGGWGPSRICFLLSAILLSVGVSRRQGPLIVVILVAVGLLVAALGVWIERRWIRHSAEDRQSTNRTQP